MNSTAAVAAPSERHILFLDCGCGRGGSASVLYYLLRHLDAARFPCEVAFYGPAGGWIVEAIRGLGVPVWFLTGRAVCRPAPARWRWLGLAERLREFVGTDLPRAARLFRQLRRRRPDLLVLANDVHYHVPAVLAARLARVPCLCRKAGGIGEGAWIKRLLAGWVDLYVSVSRATEEDQVRHWPATRQVRIPESIDLAAFTPRPGDPALRRRLGLPADAPVAGSVARFDEGKGQFELLEAAALVLREVSDACFLLVGDEVDGSGGLRARLEARTRELGISGRVFFTGWRRDVSELLALMDVFVHCPTTFLEGMGAANLEAMAMAKPSVASRNGGLTDAVVDGVTGWLVRPGDIQAMAVAITRLLRDRGLRLRMGRNARQRVESEFNYARNARRYERLFEELTDKPWERYAS